MKDDSLKRAWVELAHSNPDLLSSFRKVLLAFHASDDNKNMGTAGTGLIVADTPELLFFISAKHVIEEGVLKIQKPYTRFDGGPFSFAHEIKNVKLSGRLKVSVFGDDNAFLANVVYVSRNDSTDIVIGLAEIPEKYRTNRFWSHIPLSVAVPSVGDSIHICSLVNKEPVQRETEQNGREFIVERGVTLRKGTVTGVYPTGLRQYKWPCFTTSIPVEAGLSGGFAYLPIDGCTVAACGIVCAETSGASATNYCEAGESVVASSWPALANTVPTSLPRIDDSKDLTLFEMIKSKQFPRPCGDFDKIKFLRNSLSDISIGIK
jgi:hypothetical protein